MPIMLVLLPGLDGTGILFQPLIDLLPDSVKPVVVKYPSDRKMTYAQLLPLVMAALPASEPFVLFGESFSGPLAVQAAATKPPNLLGLILCATFVTPPIPWIGWAVPLLARSLFFGLFPSGQRIKAVLGRYSTPALQALFAQVHQQVTPGLIAFRVREVFKIDVRKELGSCETPILYIAAARDTVVPAVNLRRIQSIRPDVKVVTIASPHGIPQTRPAEVLRAILDFMAALEPSGNSVST